MWVLPLWGKIRVPNVEELLEDGDADDNCSQDMDSTDIPEADTRLPGQHLSPMISKIMSISSNNTSYVATISSPNSSPSANIFSSHCIHCTLHNYLVRVC